jgi:hypothetical protein
MSRCTFVSPTPMPVPSPSSPPLPPPESHVSVRANSQSGEMAPQISQTRRGVSSAGASLGPTMPGPPRSPSSCWTIAPLPRVPFDLRTI